MTHTVETSDIDYSQCCRHCIPEDSKITECPDENAHSTACRFCSREGEVA